MADLRKQEVLTEVVRSVQREGVPDPAVDTAFAAQATEDILVVAEQEQPEEQALLTNRLEVNEERVDDLVTLFLANQKRPVLTNVLRRHKKADVVNNRFIALLLGQETAQHAVVRTFLDGHAPAKQALTKYLHDTASDAAANERQLEIGTNALVVGIIPQDEADLLYGRPESTTANLVTVGMRLTDASKAKVLAYLRTTESRVESLFDEAHKDAKNTVASQAIAEHTSSSMDEKLRKEFIFIIRKDEHKDEDVQRVNTATRLRALRREAKAKAAAAAGASASATPPVTPDPDADPGTGASA